MATAIPKTPQKIYSTTNVCCLCGFSFVVKEIDNEGKVQYKKLSKLKLRLSKEKQTIIRAVTNIPSNAEGVCVKCFAKVEKVAKYRKEIEDILSMFEIFRKRNLAKTPGSSTRKKRGRSSPRAQAFVCDPEVSHVIDTQHSHMPHLAPQPPENTVPQPETVILLSGGAVPQPASMVANEHAFSQVTNVSRLTNATITECRHILPKPEGLMSQPEAVKSDTQHSHMPHLAPQPPENTVPQPETVILLSGGAVPQPASMVANEHAFSHETNVSRLTNATITEYRHILPKPEGLMSQPEGIVSQSEAVGPKHKETKKVRRSLGFSNELDNSAYIEEVKVTVYYPCGERTSFVKDKSHRKICRAIWRGQNVDKCILDIMCESRPDLIASSASKIVSSECRELCRRGSGSILQEKAYDSIFTFSWDKFNKEVQMKAPHTLKIISSMISDIVVPPQEKKYLHIMQTMSDALHGRSEQMSSIQYQIGFILTHGGCKQRDIDRLAKIGLCMSSKSISNKLLSWENFLDTEVLEIKKKWSEGGDTKYQLIGDNWDKNIIPTYRTSQDKTISLHLFNVIAVIDRITPVSPEDVEPTDMPAVKFIPTLDEQTLLVDELSFIVATSVIQNLDQMQRIFEPIYPRHLSHKYSEHAGKKTQQYSIGLFDCNENKTQDVIRLLKDLTEKYVPMKDGEICEEVFFGGDRLTDERIQGAQSALSNAATGKQRLEGFISKIEDWHRMMNFMEAIAKLTYSTSSQRDRGTVYYFRNILNARNVKHEVKNAFRAYKMLYYSIFDAICCVMFLKEFDKDEFDSEIDLPDGFLNQSDESKISWMNSICRGIVQKWFFDNQTDIFGELRQILDDPNHPENYWVNTEENGRFRCHYCEKMFAFVGSLKKHESVKHQHVTKTQKTKATSPTENDELMNHVILIFKLIALLKNLDTAIDMADGCRSVRSAKYEMPIFNRTHKLKYVIGCVQLIDLTEHTLTGQQRERLIANRTVNIQGGSNNNIALDEYLEILNRDSKNIVSGHQTKESIIKHSKQFPHLVNYVKHFDIVSEIRGRKGFHRLPSYKTDVAKIAKELLEINVLVFHPERKLHCKDLCVDKDPFFKSEKGLSTLIHRHKPLSPFCRLRNKTF